MPTNILRGDAPARQQVTVIGPPPDDQLDGRFVLTLNGKTLELDGWSAAVIIANWPTTIPEFAEITPTATENGGLQLTGLADGTPFYVAVESTAHVTITQVVAGKLATAEVQRVTLPPATAGTFTLSYTSAFTSGAIAYNASAATVETAISGITTFFPAVTATVTGEAGGPWDITFEGAQGPGVLMTANVSGLTLDTSNMMSVTTVRNGDSATTGWIALSAHGNTFTLRLTEGGSKQISIGTTAADLEAFLEAQTGADWTVTKGGDGVTSSYWDGTSTAPTSNVGSFVAESNEVPPGTVPGFVSGTPGTAGLPEIQRINLTGAGGGTFTLTVTNPSGTAQTTGALAWNITPTALETALEALSNLTDVFVSGAAGLFYEVTFSDPAGGYIPMTFNAASLTSAATIQRITPFASGAYEVQSIELPSSVTGGTFTLRYNAEETAALAYNLSAASLDSALEGLTGIGASGVAVTKTGERLWTVTFATLGAKSRLQADSDSLTNVATAAIVESVRAGGPTHWNDPLNWTLGRPPESGDTVWLDQPGINILHSLRQRTGISLGDSDADTLLADGDMHFADGQKITLRTTDTLPGGLSEQDYYVVDPDEANRTFKVSTTRGGDPVDLTSGTGTGTHTALVELDAPAGTAVLNPTARFSGRLGLPRRNASDYWEYRPLSLAIGVRATGSQLVRIGAGDGPGSGRLKIDLGTDEAEIRVVQTGGSAEGSVPACLLTVSNNAVAFIQHDGDSGLAFFPEDEATIGTLDVRGGSFSTGDSVTIEGAITAVVGSVRGRYLDASGNSHRWE